MDIRTVIVGPLSTNCYLLINGNDCLVVDPGDDYHLIVEAIGNLNVVGVLLTHSHFDHIGALKEIEDKYQVKVYSRENLLNTVWGYEYPGDARTVDVHIRRLREKVESNPSEPKYVHTKWGVGYYFHS